MNIGKLINLPLALQVDRNYKQRLIICFTILYITTYDEDYDATKKIRWFLTSSSIVQTMASVIDNMQQTTIAY